MRGRFKSLVLPFFLLAPAALMMLFFYLGGLISLFIQSLQTYVPGRIIQISTDLTLQNYVEYFGKTIVYYSFLWDTLRLAGIAVIISVLIGYPLAYKIVRAKSAISKKVLLASLVLSFFVNGIVKVYSWVIMLGGGGLVNLMLITLGFDERRFLGTDWAVIIGMTYFLSTIVAMTLIGPLKNVDPLLEEASMNLGATKTETFLKVTLPLSMPGVIASTMLAYAIGVSSFMVPMFLGRGFVLMMSNIIYGRYSESFNYPGGAALSVVLLATTLIIAYGINKIMTRRLKGFR